MVEYSQKLLASDEKATIITTINTAIRKKKQEKREREGERERERDMFYSSHCYVSVTVCQ